jgi:putative DNA primase/helicase
VVVERLLSISGEDAITIDRKNREAWTGTLPTRIVIATNELPRLSDASGALASRMIILNTPESFYGRENHDLTDHLMGELPGIFNWALDGLDRLRRTGRLSVPESGLALRAEMETLASPVKAFVNDWCVVDHRLWIHREYLFKAWERWCAENRVQPGDGRVFGRNLRAAVPHLGDLRPNQGGERIWAYSGIGLRDDVVAYLGTQWW